MPRAVLRQPIGKLVAADFQRIGAVRAGKRLRRGFGIGIPADLAQSPRVAIPDRRSGFLHVERQADVVGSLRFYQPKASGHPRLDDDNPPVTGQFQDHPLAPSRDAGNRRPATAPGEFRDRTALNQARVTYFDPLQLAPRSAQVPAREPSFRPQVAPALCLSPRFPPFYAEGRKNTTIPSSSFTFFQNPSCFLKPLDKPRLILKNRGGS